MPKFLTEQQVEQYRSDGYLCPLDLLSAEEVAYYRGVIEAHERQHGGPLKGPLRHKTHLLFTALNDLVRHPRLLDAVEDILGPNLLCWSTSFFIKEARDPAFVSWHQDATYWGLSSPDVTTVWLAFTPASVRNGCMK